MDSYDNVTEIMSEKQIEELIDEMDTANASTTVRLEEIGDCKHSMLIYLAKNDQDEYNLTVAQDDANDWWQPVGKKYEVCASACLLSGIPNGSSPSSDLMIMQKLFDDSLAKLREHRCKCVSSPSRSVDEISNEAEASSDEPPAKRKKKQTTSVSMTNDVESWINSISRKFENQLHAMREVSKVDRKRGLATAPLKTIIDHAFANESLRVRKLVEFALDSTKPECSQIMLDDDTMDDLLHMDMSLDAVERRRQLSMAMSRGRFRFPYTVARARVNRKEQRSLMMTRGHFCDFLLSFNATARHVFRMLTMFAGQYGELRLTPVVDDSSSSSSESDNE